MSGLDLLRMKRIFRRVSWHLKIWGGHIKIKEETKVSFVQGGHSWVFACLSGENGQDTHLSNFALMYLKKGQILKNCLCRCRKLDVVPYAGKHRKVYIAPVSGCGPKFARTCVFLLGAWWVGGLLFLGLSHLALNPSYFRWFVFVFCVFLVWSVFCLVFVLRIIFSVSLSFSLACLLSLSLFFLSLFRPSSFSLFLLSCFEACLSCLVSLLLFHEMNFGACLSYLVSLLLFDEMNNFKILN